MNNNKHGVVLAGRGGVPADFSPELISKFKRRESQRRAADDPHLSRVPVCRIKIFRYESPERVRQDRYLNRDIYSWAGYESESADGKK